MLIFSFTLFYTGLHQVVWGGVYTTSIGFTEALGEDRKKIAALCGIMFGAGEVLGGILFGFVGNLTLKRGRDPVILLGFSVSVISYFLIFINLPASAPLQSTLDLGEHSPSLSLYRPSPALKDTLASQTPMLPTSRDFSWDFLTLAS